MYKKSITPRLCFVNNKNASILVFLIVILRNLYWRFIFNLKVAMEVFGAESKIHLFI